MIGAEKMRSRPGESDRKLSDAPERRYIAEIYVRRILWSIKKFRHKHFLRKQTKVAAPCHWLEWVGALLAEIARHVTRTRRIREFLRFQSNTKSVEIRRGARHARVQQRTETARCEREAYAARMLRRDCRQIFIIGLDKSLIRVMQSRSRVFTFSFRVDLDEERTWQRNALCRKRTRRSSTLWKSLAATVLCITSARSRAVPRRNAGSRKTRHRNAAAITNTRFRTMRRRVVADPECRRSSGAALLVESEFAPNERKFGLRDQAAGGDADGKKFSVETRLPEMQELAQSRKARREIEFLPDEALQHRGMIGQAIENFRRRQPVTPQLNRKIAHRTTLRCELRHPFFLRDAR